MTNRSIRALTTQRLRGASPAPFRVTLLFCLLYYGIDTLLLLADRFLSPLFAGSGGLHGYEGVMLYETTYTVLSIATSLFTFLLLVNYDHFALLLGRGREAGFGDLLSPFRMALRVFSVRLLTVLKTVLWSFLFALPGMWCFVSIGTAYLGQLGSSAEALLSDSNALMSALLRRPAGSYGLVLMFVGMAAAAVFCAVRYSMATFVLFDTKLPTPLVIREAKRLIRGRGWKLLGLELSYWWCYLIPIGSLCLSLLVNLGVFVPSDSQLFLLNLLLSVVSIVAGVFCLPRLRTAHAVFYDELLRERVQNTPQDTMPLIPGEL